MNPGAVCLLRPRPSHLEHTLLANPASALIQ